MNETNYVSLYIALLFIQHLLLLTLLLLPLDRHTFDEQDNNSDNDSQLRSTQRHEMNETNETNETDKMKR